MNSGDLCASLAGASWQLAIGAGAIWILAKGLSADTRAWLWRAVGLKALVALFFVVPLAWLAPEPVREQEPPSTPLADAASEQPTPVSRTIAGSTSRQTRVDPESALAAIWAVGTLFAAGFLGRGVVRARRLARAASIEGSAETVFGHRVIRTRATHTPLIVGIARPTILLPDDSDSSLALAHELAHADRRDLVWHVALSVVRAVFWFHPLAWLAASEHRQACEEASDSLALARTGASPREYSGALLAFASAPAKPVTALGSSASTLRRRILQMHRPRPRLSHIVAATTLSLALLVPARLASQVSVTPASPTIDQKAQALIERPAVTKEIGITPEQSERIRNSIEANSLEIRFIGDRIAEMKRRGVPLQERVDLESRLKSDWYAKCAKDALGVLSSSQRDRLRQIALQATGPLALGQRPVGSSAGLPQTKIDRIAKIAAEARRAAQRLGTQNVHEGLERLRKGLNLPPDQRKRYLELDAKNRRLWDSDEFRKYQATWTLAEDDPRRIAASKAYNAWVAKNPNRLTQQENAEFMTLTRLAGNDPGQEARSQRYSRLARESNDRFSRQVLQLLTPEERKNWGRLLGKIIVLD